LLVTIAILLNLFPHNRRRTGRHNSILTAAGTNLGASIDTNAGAPVRGRSVVRSAVLAVVLAVVLGAVRSVVLGAVLVLAVVLGAVFTTAPCFAQETTQQAMHAAARVPIRFLLTFDDGPSASIYENPTETILAALEKNTVQPNIKAIFFAQTRAVNGGGTELGRSLLRREYEAGHLLAFHSATPRHSNHRWLGEAALNTSIELGISDLTSITGSAPKLVRPPFWNFDEHSFAAYQKHGLHMLLTDLSAKDGVIYGINFSLTKHRNMRTMLQEWQTRWKTGGVPVVDGIAPVVVTFHDVNRYTASVITDYLQILLEVAQELNIPTADKPFYDNRDDLERAALACTVSDPKNHPPLPGFWNWLWN